MTTRRYFLIVGGFPGRARVMWFYFLVFHVLLFFPLAYDRVKSYFVLRHCVFVAGEVIGISTC